MKKIPTVFKRIFDENGKFVELSEEFTNELCETAFKHGVPTIKLDGTAARILDEKLYVRYDAKLDKNGNPKPLPEGAIPCQERDPITGHLPCWIPADRKNHKWHCIALDNYIVSKGHIPLEGTYEIIGPHFQNNPYNLERDIMEPHGAQIACFSPIDRSFEYVREWLKERNVEGLVFWLDDKPVCKIKRTDFHFEWNGRK